MHFKTRSELVAWHAVAALILASTVPAAALDGANSLGFVPAAGWGGFELVTQNDNISAFSDPGYGNTASRGTYDGLGGYLSGNTLSIQVNHETSNAAISRVDVGLADFKQAIQSTIDGGATAFPSSIVTGMGYAANTIFDGSYHAINNPNPVATGAAGVAAYGNSFFDRFCSGSSYVPEAFGAGRGLVDHVYITGEEVSGGKFYATDQVTRTMWEVPDLGLGAWENAAQIDTGNTTHTAMLLLSDIGSSPGDYIRLYVGEKDVDDNGDGEIDFLERNGLRGGTVYFFDPDGGASTTNLPDNGGQVSGTWSTSTLGALRETKLEDVHSNPLDGTEAVFADQTDGVYKMDLNLVVDAGGLDTGLSATTITQIINDTGTGIESPDNLTWSEDGKLYIQEDGGGNQMWQANDDGTGVTLIAAAGSEPSGIFDASEFVGYEPGSVLLTSLQGFPAQLSVMISPTATPLPLLLLGDANNDGVVTADDLVAVQQHFGNSGPNFDGTDLGDADDDGVVTADDLIAVQQNFGAALGGTGGGSPVPEPSTLALMFIAGLGAARIRRGA